MDYSEDIQTVQEMIAEYGQLVTFKRPINIVADINKPWEITDDEPLTEDIFMVFLSPSITGASLFGKELLQYLTGSNIPSGTVRGYCGQFTYEPKLNDIIIRDGNELTIKSVDTLAPNGQSILHTLEFDV